MTQFDLPLDELERYLPARDEPADFDAFWADSIGAARRHPIDARFEVVDAGYSLLVTEDVTFAGWNGEPVKGWMLRPAVAEQPLPAVVTYIGYGGGRGYLGEWTALAAAGYAHFVMDLRGQGSGHRTGDTPDGTIGPHTGGFLTMGIDDPEQYYYRRLYTDAVRALEAARAHPSVDPDRIIVSGGSQGGALSLAAASLSAHAEVRVAGAIIDVPFMSHFRRAARITDAAPYSDLVRYLGVRREHEARAFRTLGYFDGVNLAARSTVPAAYSVGLLDEVCPPSTVFASYNHYAGPKQIEVFPYNAHEGGGAMRTEQHVRLAEEFLAR